MPNFFRRHPATLLPFAFAAALVGGCVQESAEEQLSKAKSHLEQSERPQAIIRLKSALQGDPALQEARYLLGVALLESGDAVGAQIELRKLREAGYRTEDVVPRLAQAMLKAGNVDRLLTELGQESLQSHSGQAELKAAIAMAHGARGKLELAGEAVQAALKRDPENGSARLVEARLLAAGGDRKGALERVDSLLAKNPKFSEAGLFRAVLLSMLGRSREEIESAYRQVLAVEPANLDALGMSTLLAAHAKDWSAAQAYLELMQRHHPRQLATLFIAASLDAQKGELGAAHQKVQALLKLAPAEPSFARLAGVIEYQRGNFLQAASHLGRALSGSEFQLATRVLLARSQLQLGDPQRSLMTLRPLLDRGDLPNEARLTAAEAYLQVGDTAAASKLFQQAAQQDPRDPRARTAWALAQFDRAGLPATEAALREIAQADAGVVAELALVTLRMSRQLHPEALLAIDELEAKLKASPLPHLLRGRVELARGDQALARKHFERALQIKPDLVPAVSALADLDVRAGQREAAVRRFQQLAQVSTGSLPADLAVLQLRAEGGAAAVELVTLAAEVSKRHPGEVQPRLALIRAMLAANQFKEAVGAAQQAAVAFPGDAEFLELLSIAHQQAGDIGQAQAAATRMASLHPNSPMAYMRMAELSLSQKNASEAKAHLQRALSVRDDFTPAYMALADLLMAEGKFDEARALASSLQKRHPAMASGWLLTGEVERRSRRPKAAAAAFQTALDKREDVRTAMQLHTALVAGGERTEAARFAAEWLKRRPGDAVFKTYLGQQAIEAQDLVQAERLFQELVGEQPGNVVALNNLAWTQMRLGKPDALANVQRAIAIAPRSAAVLDTLAAVHAARKEWEEALAAQRRAVDAEPSIMLHRLHLVEYLARSGQKDVARAELARIDLATLAPPLQARWKALKAGL
ncbi:MAG: XrtA/PEP-CTERM system TPR-repeat protein PrsT [Inhella sp.]